MLSHKSFPENRYNKVKNYVKNINEEMSHHGTSQEKKILLKIIHIKIQILFTKKLNFYMILLKLYLIVKIKHYLIVNAIFKMMI